MSSQKDPEFDRYAHSYKAMHKESVQASGEEPDYFAAYKAGYMASSLDGYRDQAFRLLDFGCGVGGSIPHLRKCFPRASIEGVDVSGESIELARQANADARFNPIHDDRLPLADNSADVAMAACVYHHIEPGARDQWTRELRRVIRPDGHFFLFEHNPLNPLTRKVVRDCPFDEDAILLSSGETIELLRDAGFKQVKVDYIVFFPRAFALLRPLEKHLSKIPLGAQYVVHGIA